jgi:uncharacterized protein YdeI (YjbR/CyaY-like superfamily)
LDAKVRFFASAADFRRWLEAHHGTAKELWVGFRKRATGEPSITWPESVDEALCFGWIDGVRHSIDERSYKIRFTPRRETSVWSAVNLRRAGELLSAGRMREAGRRAFEKRRADSTRYSYEQQGSQLAGAYEQRLRANGKAWAFFQAQPPGYRRTAGWWVMSAKREETRQKRLRQLIADSESGRRIGPLRRAKPED